MEGSSKLDLPESTRDRRGPSRDDALQALGRLLDGVRRDGAFRSVAVADPQGILVAGAGAHAECEELAALAPLAAPGAANDTIPTRLEVMARRMEVRRLTIDGIEVLLCGQDGEADALRRAAAGCARILGGKSRR